MKTPQYYKCKYVKFIEDRKNRTLVGFIETHRSEERV